MKEDFNEFFQTHERRIYYQIERLRIPRDLYEEFYAEGILALWYAHKNYNPDKGSVGTFINYQIRFRMIDLIRKNTRDRGIVLENEAFWEEVKRDLTPKQWKWVQYFIIANLSIKEIMEIENVSADVIATSGNLLNFSEILKRIVNQFSILFYPHHFCKGKSLFLLTYYR